MFPKLLDNWFILHSLGPAITHEADVEQVDVSLISWIVYSYGIAHNLMAKGISEKLQIY